MRVVGIMTDWKRPSGNEGVGAIGWYRVKNPLEKLGFEVLGKIELGTPEQALDLKSKGDIWFWKPVDNEGMNVLIDTAREFTGAKMVLDLDDEPFDINQDHPLFDEIKEKSERIKRMIEISDHIVVSTEQLKHSLLHFGKKITVIPNAIDTEIWNVKKTKRNDGKVRIGWVGSASHIADIPEIRDAFTKILEKYPQVELHVCGFVANDSAETRQFHHKGTDTYLEYPQFLADLSLDIAVAPLIDSKFNRAKSNIKWLENAMLETPMVLSNIPPYSECVEHGKTGFLASNTDEWVSYLSELIEDAPKRKKIGKNARREVLSKYTIEKQLPKYQALFDKLEKKNVVVYSSIVGDKNTIIEDQNTEGANFIMYSDLDSDTWEIRKPYDKFKKERINSRIQKLMPHLFLDCEYSVYIDGNVRLNVPAQKLIDEFLKDKDIAVFRHVGRDCIYEEAGACLSLGKGEPKEILEQCKEYARRGVKEHDWLAECSVIIRRHTEDVARMNERWWAHYCRYSERDQISFPVAFEYDKVNLIEGSGWRHPYFTFIAHVHEK